MTAPGTDPTEKPRQASRLHPAGLTMAVAGLAVTVMCVGVAFVSVQQHDKRLREQSSTAVTRRVEKSLDGLNQVVSGVATTISATQEAQDSDIRRIVQPVVNQPGDLLIASEVFTAEQGVLNEFANADEALAHSLVPLMEVIGGNDQAVIAQRASRALHEYDRMTGRV